MIENIFLKNFKAFSSADLSVRPLTLLAGMNGMGKSSVIQSLLLLRQSYQAGELQLGQLQLNGSLVEIGTARDLMSVDAAEDEVGITVRAYGKEAVFKFGLARDEKGDYGLSGDFENIAASEMLAGATHEGFKALFANDGSFQYLCAERLGPRKHMPMSDSSVAAFNLGKHGEFTLHFLSLYGTSLLLKPADKRFAIDISERLIDQVDYWLQEISPGAHLELEEVRSADLMISGFSFDRLKDAPTRPFRATNVGFGLSYGLSILVALLAAPPGALVIIENPEAHMHPCGQTRLGQLCARAAADGVQVILETHSDHVMDGIRLDVREGVLAPDQAVFHYFERQNGLASVTTPKLDRDGRLSTWPEGFFDQHRRNTAALIRPRGA